MSEDAVTRRIPREDARVLIVDDEPANVEFLRHVLEPEGYGAVLAMTSSEDALERFEEFRPDVVVLDLMMPGCDGFQFMERASRMVERGVYLPILVVTGDTSAETRRRALSVGAKDFLTKPLSPADLRLRVRNLLETRFLHEQLRRYSSALEERVTERTQELEAARLEILDRLARAAEYRDDDTGQHTQRVGMLAARLGAVLGMDADEVELLRRAAPLHDIGKIGTPDAILLKHGPLTPAERAVMETHTTIGASILAGSRFPLLQLAEEIALTHHERPDGCGYPEGLSGDDIPISGRIVAVADVFDSLTHERPYKSAWSVKEALAEIEEHAGTQFDPKVVEAMLRIAPESRLAPAVVGTIAPSDFDAIQQADLFSSALRADPLAARIRHLEREREDLAREVRNLRRKVGRRDARIQELQAPAS